MLYVENKINTSKVYFEDSTKACPAPICEGVGYWTFGAIPGWDIPVAGEREWIWDSECFCCSSASLLSGQYREHYYFTR